MSQSVEKLEARIAALEEAFERVQKLKGIPGPRGAAGPIDAASRNAENAVANAENRVQRRAEERYAQFASDVKALRDELREFKAQTLKDALDSHVIPVLQDYHLLDSNTSPTLAADVTAPRSK
jgi:DNA repair exonuclease SbcCD ATPase subunit